MDPTKPSPISLALNQFAIDLYQSLICMTSAKNNAFCSPFSILAAVSMVNTGAKGTTREQILTATKLKNLSDIQPIDSLFKSLFSNLHIHTTPAKEPQKKSALHREDPYFVLANRIYIQNGFQVIPEFSETLQDSYDTTTGKADFLHNALEAAKEISQWVESITNNRIQNLFNELESDTKMALISAVYFKAEWEDHFPENRTVEMEFLGETESFNVPFMKYLDNGSKFAVFDELDATALLKPYAFGSVHMLIILPNRKDGLHALEERLSPVFFDVTRYKKAPVEIAIPRFKISSSYDLKTALQTIGIVDAFNENADFTGIAEEELRISEAVHKTFIEVNEKGTEAAAATGLKIMAHSGVCFDDNTPKIFQADHPFLFVIQQRETGAVLFMGRVSRFSQD